MAEVTFILGGVAHRVDCEDGQQQHVARLAADIDERMRALARAHAGSGGGTLRHDVLLVMAALLLADQVDELLRSQQEAAGRVDALADRLGSVAARLEEL